MQQPMRQNFVMRDVSNSEDGASKISRSRSKNNVSTLNKLKEKEQGWNDRFHLQQIPEYNYHNEPFAHYLKNKGRNPRNDKVDFASGKPRKNREFRDGSLEKNKVNNKPNPSRVMERYTDAIRKAFSDLKQLWKERNIPEQHMEVMTKVLSKENNPMKILEDIQHEFQQISKESSFIQKVVAAVLPREECMNKLRDLFSRTTDQAAVAQYRNEFEQMLHHYRILSIHCVECIYQWRKNLELVYERPLQVEYKLEGEGYFHRMRRDHADIVSSKFSGTYTFAERGDLFFTNVQVGGKKLMPISKPFLKRIKMCETVIQEEPPETPSAVNAKSPKAGKSLPPIPHSTVAKPTLTKVSVEYTAFPEYFANLKARGPYQNQIWSCLDHSRYEQYTVFLLDKVGQVVVAVDKYSSQRKISIMAAACRLDQFEKLARETCSYIWEHDQCTQIRVGLIHNTGENGSMSVDKDMEAVFKQIGFRWICVNNNNDMRITVFAHKRPLNTLSIHNHQFYPVIIEHFTSYATGGIAKSQPSCSYMSLLSILRLIMERKDEYTQEVGKNQELQHFLSQLTTTEQFSYSGLRSFAISNQQELDRIAQELIQKPQLKLPAFTSILNVSFKFRNNYIIDDRFIKFFPTKDVEIVICQSTHPIYLLQTDEENINIFVFEVEANFRTDQIESVFNAMGDQSSYIDDFWLPEFKINARYTDEAGFSNEMMVSTDYRTKLQSLTRRSKTKAKVIKPPFVFGLINKELLSVLEVPFFCTLVTKEHLVAP